MGMTTSTRAAGGLNEAVAGEIRAELARRQWSQVELATRMGVDQMWLSRRLRAVKPLTLTEFEAIAQALGLTPADLMGAAARRPGQPTPPRVTRAVRPPDGRPKNRPGHALANGRTRQKRDLTPEERSAIAA